MRFYFFVFALNCLFFSGSIQARSFDIPCTMCDFFETDSLMLQISDCNDIDSVCIDIPLEDFLQNYQISVNGAAYTGLLNGCNIDSTFVFYYDNITGSGDAGPYHLDAWSINGVVYSGDFPDMPALVDSMNLWNPTGNWVLNPAAHTIVGGTPGYNYSEMDVFHPALNISSQIFFVIDENPNGSMIYFGEGIHEFVVAEIVGDCSDTLAVFMACINAEVKELVADIGATDTLCIDFADFLTTPAVFNDFCPDSWGQSADFSLVSNDSCLQITALNSGIDSFCLEVCDEIGFCDTTTFLLVVPNPGVVYEHFDTIALGNTDLFCFNAGNFLGTIQNISDSDTCPANTGNSFASTSIDFTSNCLNIQGEVAGGQDTTCWVVCDNYGTCDTTLLYIFVDNPVVTQVEWVETTIFLNTSAQFCPDQSELITSPESITDRCAVFNGEFVAFNPDLSSFCIEYTGIDIGCDTACIYLTDSQTTIDTTFLVVCTQLPEIEYITDTLMLGEATTYCLQTAELGGTANSIQVCENNSENTVNFDINNVDLCVTPVNLSEGNYSVCLFICDEFSICDTTIIDLTVIPPDVSDPPVASDDSYLSSQNDNLVIHYCENDSIPGNYLTNGYLLLPDMGGAGPQNGQIDYLDDCSLIYVPNIECPFVDSLTYIICNEFGCDTANVAIFVECAQDDFLIFNGFSPNGDGINDYFQIAGIERFPDHALTIFNRWGNTVFQAQNYQNDWAGITNNQDLPDGTYFYLFDDGAGKTYSGYVVLHR